MPRCNIFKGGILILLLLIIICPDLKSQTVDHWETVVMANDTWSYFPGNSEPPFNWNLISFDESSWQTGPGGIGYGDGDDATVISPVTSVYLRIKFNLTDTSAISMALLHVDFDDGFVAYMNGHEIARANLGTSGTRPPYSELAILDSYEARLPSGGNPARFLIEKGSISDYMIQGENILALQVHNCSTESSDLSSTAFLSVGIKNNSHDYRETPSWFSDPLNEFSNLPLIVIETGGQTIKDNPKTDARLKVIDNEPGSMNNQFQHGTDYEGNMGIEIRGQSSQMFPKKSYSIELRGENGSDTSAALLGMPVEEDWVLYAPYSDKTMLRNALTFYLGSRMGGWQPRYRFCELYLNGDYNGIYVLTESIKRDSNRVDISKLKPDEISGDDLTGGYIVKVDKLYGLGPDEYFQISPSIHYHNSDNYIFTYVYPKSNEIVSAQKNYIRNYLTDTENSLNSESFSDPITGFRKYIDVKSFVDFQIIQELTNNVDGYRLSTFFNKDKDSNGGKLNAGPLWDFDLCYGNEDYTDFNLQTDTWLYTKFENQYGGRIHWWARMMEDLGYRGVFMSRWRDLRRGAFSTDSIMTFLDNKIEYLGEAIDRNFTRWPVLGTYVWPNYFIGETYEDEVGYLKRWITDRVDWIDANIMVAENVSENYSKNDLLVFPNPAREQINLYFYLTLSGEIKIEIFDLLGRKVFQNEIIPENTGYQYFSFGISNLASGYYVLRLMQGDKQIGRKNIIVNRR
jgi:hypothetical protein